jgi:pimeloyl-ACP methyl ester carboxylesterase
MGRGGALVVLALVVSGCAAPGDTRSLPTCDEVACTGVLNGAAYEIVLPESWNGTLVLYSHGYRSAQPVPPDFAPVNTAPDPAPRWAGGDRAVGEALLDQGYALAGSAYASNGWAVAEGVAAGLELIDFFRTQIAQPERVYVWGESMGGLITAVIAQERPEIDGAIALCGALAGVNPNMDLAVTVLAMLQESVWPGVPLEAPKRYEDALAVAIAASSVIVQLAGVTEDFDFDVSEFGFDTFADAGLDIPALEVPVISPDPDLLRRIGDAVDAPTVTRTFDGATPESEIRALTEGLVTATSFGVLTRYELATRVGGDPAVPYVGMNPAADPNARNQAVELGDANGQLAQPTIALHTEFDSVTIAPNVTWFAERVSAQGRTDQFQAIFTSPPPTFRGPAPYGAGHCNFDNGTLLGVLGLLDSWVQGGEQPDEAAVRSAIRGYAPGLEVGGWPVDRG